MAMEGIQSAKVICRGGLDTNQNYLELSDLSPGAATRLLNFEPSLYGGYRRINGFTPYNASFPQVDPTNAEGAILCVALFNGSVIVARKQKLSNTYNFYYAGGVNGWEPFVTGLTLSSVGVERIRFVTYNFAGTEKISFVDGVNGIINYNGTSWVKATGDQIIPAPRYIAVFKNHLFVSGDDNNPHIISHSAPNAEGNFAAAAGGGQILAGFKVRQIKPFRESLFVFGMLNIKRVEVEGTGFLINDVASNIGCVAPDSVVEIAGDLLFLSQDGLRTVSATDKIGDINLAAQSKKIQNTLKDAISTYSLNNLTAVVIRSKSQIRYFFSESTREVADSYGVIGGLVGTEAGIEWEWGEILGIRCSCTDSGYQNTTEVIIHGDYDGSVYKQESGITFNGVDITALYQTPYLDFGDPSIRKTLRTLTMFLRPEGNLEMNVSVKFDWAKADVVNPTDYVTQTTGQASLYGSVTYDGGATYGGVAAPVMDTNMQGSFNSVQLTFVSMGYSPYSLQGFINEFTVNGRK